MSWILCSIHSNRKTDVNVGFRWTQLYDTTKLPIWNRLWQYYQFSRYDLLVLDITFFKRWMTAGWLQQTLNCLLSNPSFHTTALRWAVDRRDSSAGLQYLLAWTLSPWKFKQGTRKNRFLFILNVENWILAIISKAVVLKA